MISSVVFFNLIVTVIVMALLLMSVSLIKMRERLDNLSRRFDEHGHNASEHGPASGGPVSRKHISLDTLVDKIRNVGNFSITDVRSGRRFVDSETKS